MKAEAEIETLARITAKGFISMEQGFSSIREEMQDMRDDMDEGFSSLRIEIRDTNRRIDSIIIPEIADHARSIKDRETSPKVLVA